MEEDSNKLVSLNFKNVLLFVFIVVVAQSLQAQFIDTLINQQLRIEVTITHACNKTRNNGTITFRILGSQSNKATVDFLIQSPGDFSSFQDHPLEIGGTTSFTYFNLKPGKYSFGIFDSVNESQSISTDTNQGTNVLEIKSPAEFPTLAFQVQQATCKNSNDGIITVSQTGGSGTYKYSKDNGSFFQASNIFDKLAAGSYEILLKDELNCRYGPESKVVTEPDSVSITVNGKNPLCSENANGEVLIDASGGNGSFQYSIDNGVTFVTNNQFKNLKAGNFLVTVKDSKGCRSSTKTISLTSPSAIIPTNSVTEETCFNSKDGSILVTGIGGSGGYTYSNDGGKNFISSSSFTNLSTGSYSILIKDINGCLSASQSVTLKAKPQIQVKSTKTEISTCTPGNDGSFNLIASDGKEPYEFSIDNGVTYNQNANFTGLTPSSYQVIAKDANGCKSSPSIIELKLPEILQTIKQKTISCNGKTDGIIEVQAKGGTGPYQYSIDNGVTFSSSSSFSSLGPTMLEVVTRDGSGCISKVEKIDFKEPDPLSFQSKATNAGCTNNGSIELSSIGGGTKPYEFTLNGLAVLILTDNHLIKNLGKGEYKLEMKDANGCSKTDNLILTQLPAVQAKTEITGPNCSGDGLNGKIVVTLTSEGNYETGITKSLTNPPSQFFPINSSTSSVHEFKNLTKGSYYIIIKGGSLCDAALPTIINGGPDPISFSVSSQNKNCFEDQGTLLVSGLNGAVNLPFTININKGNTNLFKQTINYDQSKGKIDFKVTEVGEHTIFITQNQSTVHGCLNEIKSPIAKVEITGPNAKLDTLEILKSPSFTDAPSGKVVGNISPSGYEPYESSLELIDPEFNGQSFFSDFSSINKNPETGLFEFKYEELFAGTYNLSLRDDYGCLKDFEIKVLADPGLFIPNIFTPNDDNINDSFVIRNLPRGSVLTITNRWGIVVYESKDYKNDWKGTGLPDGVYYYYLVSGGQKASGWVELFSGN